MDDLFNWMYASKITLQDFTIKEVSKRILTSMNNVGCRRCLVNAFILKTTDGNVWLEYRFAHPFCDVHRRNNEESKKFLEKLQRGVEHLGEVFSVEPKDFFSEVVDNYSGEVFICFSSQTPPCPSIIILSRN